MVPVPFSSGAPCVARNRRKSTKEEITGQNAEVTVVFREDREQVEGLKKIKKSQKTNFTLVSDLGAKAPAV